MTQILTSTRSARVRRIASLTRRRERRLRGLHLAEGPNAAAAALAAGLVDELLVTDETWLDGLSGAALDDVRVTAVSEAVLQHVCDAVTPQGVVAVVRTATCAVEDLPPGGVVLVLDRLGDPGNVGTVVRTAHALGATGVIALEGSADPHGPKAVRSAAGATYRIALVVDVEAGRAVTALRDQSRRIVTLSAAGTAAFDDVAAHDPGIALVVGSEAHGVGPEFSAATDQSVAIDMVGDAESLNAAIACGIALHALAPRFARAGGGRRRDR
ncbi:MAG: RNA methyltransferase [Nitriliruptoraceae bacterium]